MQPGQANQDERALVAACVRGEPQAWERFYERYHAVVVRAAERALRKLGVDDPQTQAADVAGEVFANLLARERAALAAFRGRSLATWLRVLARRRASRGLRRQRPGTLDEPLDPRADGPSPSDVAQVSERERIVREQLEALSPRDRLALQLFYEGGRSYDEVADALGLPADRVGTLLARARKRLAKHLGERLG